MQFHSTVIGGKSSGQETFLRRVNATPKKDGYGHESFIFAFDNGSHIRTCPSSSSSSSSSSCDQVLKFDDVVFLPKESCPSPEKIIKFEETTKKTLPSGCLVHINIISAEEEINSSFSSSAFLSPESVTFLHQERHVRAISTNAKSFKDILMTESSLSSLTSPIPLLGNMMILMNQVVESKQQEEEEEEENESEETTCNNKLQIVKAETARTIFALPLNYGFISQNLLPACFVSFPTKRNMKILSDCTQRVVSSSPIYPGEGAQVPVRICCAAVGNVKKTESKDSTSLFASVAEMTSCSSSSSASASCCSPSSSSSVLVYMSEDVGTHIDSSSHFDGPRSISDLTPRELFAPAVIIDISQRVIAQLEDEEKKKKKKKMKKKKEKHTLDQDEHKKKEEEKGKEEKQQKGEEVEIDEDEEEEEEQQEQQQEHTELTVQDLLDWEERNKMKIPAGALVCLRSSWSRFFNSDPKRYVNNLKFPAFSTASAKWLLENRPNICGLGCDTLSPDAVVEFPVHELMLKHADKYHVENMVLDPDLPECGCFILSAPLRVEGAFEAPTRCIAVTF